MSYKVFLGTKELTFEEPKTVLEILGDNKEIICASVNNRVRELTYTIDKDSKIIPLTVKDRNAKPCYESSLRFLVAMAMHNLYPNLEIRFSYNVSRSIFMQILTEHTTSNGEMVSNLIKEMRRLVDLDLPLIRKIVSKEDAAKIFKNDGYEEKIEILKYRPEKTAHIYTCGKYRNYMYNRMVPSTGYISRWEVKFYHPGIIIQYPRFDCNGEIPPFEDAPAFGRTLKQAHQWAKTTTLDSIVGINDFIEQFGENDLINLCEQRHNRQLCELGNIIENDIENIKIICIAGPSSSGKTTFANRLRTELLSRGIQPIRISLDDYYLPFDKTPKDENGNLDFEDIHALDIDLINKNMVDLISGLEVSLPKFDFVKRCRVEGRTLRIKDTQPIIIEGIHALNDMIASSVPSHQKFKIFIAPQAQINIDNHNPLSLTDLRLLRRIVRDKQFRDFDAISTIKMWPSVRRGEFKWIYKTQEGANYVFNSLLIYELPAMKKYAMPLLESIDVESEHFPIAERLIRMLKFFKNLPTENVPSNSLIREFIGGSCFKDV